MATTSVVIQQGRAQLRYRATQLQSYTHGIMGRRFPDVGLLRYRKLVPQQLGDVIVVTNSPPIGHMRSQLTNHQVGIILDDQAWSEKLY